MGFASPVHILLVVAVIALLFGVKRLPEIGRRLGGGVREIREATGIDEFRSQVGELKESLGPGALAPTASLAPGTAAAPAAPTTPLAPTAPGTMVAAPAPGTTVAPAAPTVPLPPGTATTPVAPAPAATAPEPTEAS
jgi:TatA/E family protein of Tat protein translocase